MQTEAQIQTRFSSERQPDKHGPEKGTKYFKPLLRKLLEDEIDFDDPILKKKIKTKLGRILAIRHLMNAIQGEHNSIKDIMDRADDENVKTEINNLTNVTNIKYEWNQDNSHTVHPPELPAGDSQQPQEIQSR